MKTRCRPSLAESRRSHFAQERRSRLDGTSEDPLFVHISEFSHGLELEPSGARKGRAPGASAGDDAAAKEELCLCGGRLVARRSFLSVSLRVRAILRTAPPVGRGRDGKPYY